MAIVNKIVLLFYFISTILVSLQLMGGVNSNFLIDKIHVTIINKLPGLELDFQCKDKHHDEGLHTLKVGENYTWGFYPGLFHETLWFCGFSWTGEFHWFDIYVQVRDECKSCNWEILKSGPCLIKETSHECFLWNKSVKEGDNTLVERKPNEGNNTL